jgi:hypothetical protein
MAEPRLLKRPHFFSGRLLTVDDLAQEQNYCREKLKRHNRSLHGIGVVSGLKVTTRAGLIVIEPGMALDCEGNEVVVETTQELPPPLAIEGRYAAYVSVRYIEQLCDSVATPQGEKALIIREAFEIVSGHENHNAGHKHLRARWLACGTPHPLVIAKLRRGPQGWRVDRRYRAPAVK